MLGGSWWELVKGIAPTLETGECEGGLEHYDLSLLLPSRTSYCSSFCIGIVPSRSLAKLVLAFFTACRAPECNRSLAELVLDLKLAY